jgi:hypothetical protein
MYLYSFFYLFRMENIIDVGTQHDPLASLHSAIPVQREALRARPSLYLNHIEGRERHNFPVKTFEISAGLGGATRGVTFFTPPHFSQFTHFQKSAVQAGIVNSCARPYVLQICKDSLGNGKGGKVFFFLMLQFYPL